MKKVFTYPVKVLFLAVGWISFGLGVVGIFLPLLPTTPFLLLAAFCFSRGSPKVNQWLHDLPQIGQILTDWERYGVVGWKAKISASVLLIPTVAFLCLRPNLPSLGKISMVLLASVVLTFLWTRPVSKN